MRASRLRDIIDAACTNDSAYDCSNGILTNSATEYTSDSDTMWHELEDNAGSNAANRDTIWAYREGSTVNTAASTVITTEEDAWEVKYEGLADALVNWTVAEARYWAYEAAWETHQATYESATDSEADLLVTKEQKVDLLDAADSDVQRATRLAAMA